jgi:hypothetical protein
LQAQVDECATRWRANKTSFTRTLLLEARTEFAKARKQAIVLLCMKTDVAFCTISELHKLLSSPKFATLTLRAINLLVDEAGTVPEYITPLLCALSPTCMIWCVTQMCLLRYINMLLSWPQPG